MLDVCTRLVVLESECHRPHVTKLIQKIVMMQNEIVDINVKRVKTSGEYGDSGVCCHRHADQLLQRVTRLEADMKAAELAWKAIGGHAWQRASTTATAAAAPTTPAAFSLTQPVAAPGFSGHTGPASAWTNAGDSAWPRGLPHAVA